MHFLPAVRAGKKYPVNPVNPVHYSKLNTQNYFLVRNAFTANNIKNCHPQYLPAMLRNARQAGLNPVEDPAGRGNP